MLFVEIWGWSADKGVKKVAVAKTDGLAGVVLNHISTIKNREKGVIVEGEDGKDKQCREDTENDWL